MAASVAETIVLATTDCLAASVPSQYGTGDTHLYGTDLACRAEVLMCGVGQQGSFNPGFACQGLELMTVTRTMPLLPLLVQGAEHGSVPAPKQMCFPIGGLLTTCNRWLIMASWQTEHTLPANGAHFPCSYGAGRLYLLLMV